VTVEETTKEADCVIAVSEDDFLKIVRGEQSPTVAYMTGKLKVTGDVGLALKLQKLFF
jgi:putative sterol carrier protein